MTNYGSLVELRISNEELVNLNLEKNNLIGIVSHDLRNPLSQISSLISLIRMKSTSNEETAEYLDLMKETVHRLNQLIIKILDVEAIESKKINLKIESLNLSEILETVITRHSKDAANKNISIEKQIPGEIYGIADKNFIEQVLENLLSNAVKFSPPGCRVYVSLLAAANKVRFEIKDEGPGLTDEDKQKLFGKFQKLSARPTGGESSTGLGLSITKKFVEAMHGKIWCESETGKGARFMVELHQNQT